MLPIIETIGRDCKTVSTKARPEPPTQDVEDTIKVEKDAEVTAAREVIDLTGDSEDEAGSTEEEEEGGHDVDLTEDLTDEQLGVDCF
jgi:hypothetical protein